MMVDTDSNIPNWELEIFCPGKKFLKEIVLFLVEYDSYEYEVSTIDESKKIGNYSDTEDLFAYSLLIRGSWLNALLKLSEKLNELQNKYEGWNKSDESI